MDELKPDREGYLKFRKDYEADRSLRDAAFDDVVLPEEMRGRLGRYLDLYEKEKEIRRIFSQPADRALTDPEYISIRNGVHHRKSPEVQKILGAWEDERARSHEDYRCHLKDIDELVEERRKSHPRETESEAWFVVAEAGARAMRDHLNEQRRDAEHALRRVVVERQRENGRER